MSFLFFVFVLHSIRIGACLKTRKEIGSSVALLKSWEFPQITSLWQLNPLLVTFYFVKLS
ncbi:hypothetical protein LEP1GSC071_3596 [Leptospira santarosai str. JET]|nr:hypothetical protein LEP1GSC071_3596 [Leptospira santarosai str. JET]